MHKLQTNRTEKIITKVRINEHNYVSGMMTSKVIKRQMSAKSMVRRDRQNSRGIATEKMQKFPVIGQTF